MFINIKNSSKVKKDMVICAACTVELNEQDGNSLCIFDSKREGNKNKQKNLKENPLGRREKKQRNNFCRQGNVQHKLL